MKYFVFYSFLFLNNFVFSQNIFDAENNYKYAIYLNAHKDYEHLIAVLNDLENQQPDSINIKFWKAKTYIKLEKNKEAYQYLNDIKVSNDYKKEMDFMLLKTAILLDSFFTYPVNQFDLNNKKTAELYCFNRYYLFGKDSAISTVNSLIIDKKRQQFLLDLLGKSANNYSLKKTWLASALSIVPGLGQIYTKQYSDAYLGVLPVYINGSIAAFSFSQYGAQSIFGWVNLSMASGFYLGNIYGAYHGAKRIKNLNFKQLNDKIKKHVANLEF